MYDHILIMDIFQDDTPFFVVVVVSGETVPFSIFKTVERE